VITFENNVRVIVISHSHRVERRRYLPSPKYSAFVDPRDTSLTFREGVLIQSYSPISALVQALYRYTDNPLGYRVLERQPEQSGKLLPITEVKDPEKVESSGNGKCRLLVTVKQLPGNRYQVTVKYC